MTIDVSHHPAIAVTGADGFIGSHLCRQLESQNIRVVRIVRRAIGEGGDRRIADLESEFDATALLAHTDVLIHLAGRAHVLHETATNPERAFHSANVESTKRLAIGAMRAGIRRLVFVSSIGVNGNATFGSAFSEADAPAPREPYAVSKLDAEQALRSISAGSKLEIVIVRPPLVYGPGATGNFERLLKLAASGIPLPIGQIRNRRSLIGVSNLCDLLLVCATHPSAAGELFLAAEPKAYSTPDLVVALARALKRPARIFSVHPRWLTFLASATGKSRELEKFCASLEVSCRKAREVLGWYPSVTFEQELERVASAYRRRHEVA